jgi:hypothetical protein
MAPAGEAVTNEGDHPYSGTVSFMFNCTEYYT